MRSFPVSYHRARRRVFVKSMCLLLLPISTWFFFSFVVEQVFGYF